MPWVSVLHPAWEDALLPHIEHEAAISYLVTCVAADGPDSFNTNTAEWRRSAPLCGATKGGRAVDTARIIAAQYPRSHARRFPPRSEFFPQHKANDRRCKAQTLPDVCTLQDEFESATYAAQSLRHVAVGGRLETLQIYRLASSDPCTCRLWNAAAVLQTRIHVPSSATPPEKLVYTTRRVRSKASRNPEGSEHC